MTQPYTVSSPTNFLPIATALARVLPHAHTVTMEAYAPRLPFDIVFSILKELARLDEYDFQKLTQESALGDGAFSDFYWRSATLITLPSLRQLCICGSLLSSFSSDTIPPSPLGPRR